jgi:TetR/AcrR family transcriptional repressor of mexJK operon
VEAAKQVFLRDGYGASMDAVALEAGVSKQTVYNRFGSKETLFAAVIEAVSTDFMRRVGEPERLASDPGRSLTEFGLRYLRARLAPTSLALHRILVAEAPRFPGLAAEVFALGPERMLARLAAGLEEADRRGALRVPDPRLAAECFLGALSGHHQLRALLMVAPPSEPDALRRSVQHAVGMLVALHGGGTAGGGTAGGGTAAPAG